MNIFAVCNHKGGVAKTLSAVNLAHSMEGKNLVIDLDPQSDCSTLLSVEVQKPETSVAKLFQDKKADINDLVIDTMMLHIIPSCLELDYISLTVQSKINSQMLLHKHLANLQGFDNVFLDCPPSLGCTTQNALYAATHLIIPVQADKLSVDAVIPILEMLSELDRTDLEPRLLWTRKNGGHKKANTFLNKVKQEGPYQFFKTSIPQDQKIIESILEGKPVTIGHRLSKTAASYQVVAGEIQEWVD